jgi:hypothetical protein
MIDPLPFMILLAWRAHMHSKTCEREALTGWQIYPITAKHTGNTKIFFFVGFALFAAS